MKHLTPILVLCIFGLACNDLSTSYIPDSSLGEPITSANSVRFMGWVRGRSAIAYTNGQEVGSMLQSTVKMVDVQSGATYDLDPTPRYINYFEAHGDSVYYQALNLDNTSGVYVLSVSTPSAGPSLLTSGSDFVVSSSGQSIAIKATPFADTLTVIELGSASLRKFVVDRNDYPVAFSPDTRRLLFSSGQVLTLQDGVLASLPSSLPDLPRSIHWDIDGLWILSTSQDLYACTLLNLFDGSSMEVFRSDDNATFAQEVSWSNQHSLAFRYASPMGSSPVRDYIYFYEVPTQRLRLCKESSLTGNRIRRFALSPDGTRIAFADRAYIYVEHL